MPSAQKFGRLNLVKNGGIMFPKKLGRIQFHSIYHIMPNSFVCKGDMKNITHFTLSMPHSIS
jgi:hypothetical protein